MNLFQPKFYPMKYLTICKILTSIFLLVTNLSSAQVVVGRSRYIAFETPDEVRLPGGGHITMIKNLGRVRGSGWDVARYTMTLVKYDAEGKKVKENMLGGGKPIYSAFFAALKKSKDSIWFIFIEPAEGPRVGNIKAMPINSSTLETGEIKTLDLEDRVNMKLAISGLSDLKIYLETSPDTRQHCLFIDTRREEFYLAGFDENFKLRWSGQHTIPNYRAELINSVSINNKGEIFITSIKKENAFISIFNMQGIAEHKKLSFGTIQPTEIKFYDTEAKEGLMVSGVYSEGTDNITGVYSAVLNRSSYAVENLVSSDFPEPLIERLKKDRVAKKGAKNFGISSEFLATGIFKRNNGSLVQVLECKRRYSGDIDRTWVRSLITVSFTAGGIIFSQIPREALILSMVYERQYFTATCFDNFILFYIDHETNLNKDLDQEPTLLNGEKGAVLVAAYVGDDGKIKKRVKVNDSGVRVSEAIGSYLVNECKRQ